MSPMYWLYQTHILEWHSKAVQAKLLDPLPGTLVHAFGTGSFRDPNVTKPSGLTLQFTYLVNPRYPRPDFYFESFGLKLVSARLAKLFQSFEVRAEYFPVRMVDPQMNDLPELTYFVFRSLEGILPAMDEAQSGWTGDRDIGIPRLVLDLSRIEHRPLFLCNHIYLPLIRDDLKEAVQRNGLIGMEFLDPQNYHSGQFGTLLKFDP